jgi:hypothetical protein
MNFFSVPTFFVFIAQKKIVFCYNSLCSFCGHMVQNCERTFSYSCLSVQRGPQKDAVFKLFTFTFVISLKRAIFPFPWAHTGSGILSHSCLRFDRPLSLQGACISRLHPYSSHFSTEDDGSMLLQCWYPLLRCMVLQPRCSAE